MNVPNHEKKAFRDMTPEERSAIVEAWLKGDVEYYSHASDDWQEKGDSGLYGETVYRTRPRQLVIPWEHIKPEYKWAAMDESGSIWVYAGKPQAGDSGWGYLGGLDGVGALNINTTGIDWRESLTARPEGV